MRRITRSALTGPTQAALARRQAVVDAKRVRGDIDVEREWRAARQIKAVKTAHNSLREMSDLRERCMYCCDSHGTDLDHFWPKANYPEKLFEWLNFLLSCTEGGRFKGNRFPVENGIPNLVDPTAEDPWQFLDFDVATGVIVARFDLAAGAESQKGVETVRLLQLDRREVHNEGYRKTWRRLAATIAASLDQEGLDAKILITTLKDADDHGLLGWCFTGTGRGVARFATLHARHPDVWTACAQSLVG